MLGFFTQNVARTNTLRRRPLQVEALEDRTCPAAPTLNYTVSESMGMVRLQGQVTDENLWSVSLQFTGVVNYSAPVGPGGTFNYLVPATGVGFVHGQAYDNEGLSSGQVDALFISAAPGITFTATWGANKQVTITGSITDESPTQARVSFSGAVTGMVFPAANGTFSFTTTASQVGVITATVTDAFSQTGTYNFTLTNNAPTITNFNYSVAPGGFYTFTGTVTDEYAAGLTVTFGGITALMGKTATVNADGTFSLTIQSNTPLAGEANCRTTDWWGIQSEFATKLIV